MKTICNIKDDFPDKSFIYYGEKTIAYLGDFPNLCTLIKKAYLTNTQITVFYASLCLRIIMEN